MAAGACLGLYLSVALMGAALQSSPARAPSLQGATKSGLAAAGSLIDEIAAIVERNFYSAARLEEVGWGAAVARARHEFAVTHAAAERAAVLRKLVASLKTSHTA